MRKIELLAPAGDARSVKAAVLAGADAVYLGVGELNARRRAVNIAPEEAAELCAIAHERGCRIYLTLNVLLREGEFPAAAELLARMRAAGIDGVIVQDYGLLSAARRMFPELELHASTQMTTHNRGQLGLLARAGVKQVNLSRELSLGELKELAAAARDEGMKTELFVHGAFCVSFSGQCYLSGSVYGNSANRGACVQPCRRDYLPDLPVAAGAAVKPLNLKDNCLFASAAELIEAGADSLKIEGRIKGYDYVYSVVSAWREQLERLAAGERPRGRDERLEGVFNRGFSDNLLKGRLGADSFAPDSGDRSLSLAGTVAGFSAANGEISIVSPGASPEGGLAEGQGITVKERGGAFVCTGTLLEKRGGGWAFRIEHRLAGKIRKGQEVWAQPRLFDAAALERRLDSMKASADGKAAEEKLPLRFRLSGKAGEPLVLHADCMGREVRVVSPEAAERAEGRPVTPDAVEKQLSKLGGTPFRLAGCDTGGLEAGLFIPMRVLNELRREAASALLEALPEGKPGEAAGVGSEAAAGLPVPVPAELPERRRLAVALPASVRGRKMAEELRREEGVVLLLGLPADPEALLEAEAAFSGLGGLVPWFPSILIGKQFDAACAFLLRSGAPFIVTDNAGIAFFAREQGISWAAGPLMNGANGYALEFFRAQGASGAFCTPEEGGEWFRGLTVPQGIELWAPLFEPVFLMKSRHCLVRNCPGSGCGKEVMDDRCIPDCSRSAAVTDTQGNRFIIIKERGDYNGIWRDRPALYPERLKERRIGTFLLDVRSPDPSLMPAEETGAFVRRARRAVAEGRGFG